MAAQLINDRISGSFDLKSRSLGTALILLGPIALVAAPVLWKGTRSEIAHWYLAAAANALELGKGDAEAAIAKAQAWDPEVNKLQDYWRVRILQLENEPDSSISDVLKEVPAEQVRDVAAKLARGLARRGKFKQASAAFRELLGDAAQKEIFYWDLMISSSYLENGAAQALALIREAIELNPLDTTMRYALSKQYAMIFTNDEEFDAALDAFKIQFGDDFVRDATNLNMLAYARAMALRELDEALVDINEALTYAPQDPSLRDTRAWVLYQMGKYEEAFVDADFAVKEMEKPTLMNWLNSKMVQAATASPRASAVRDEKVKPDGDSATATEATEEETVEEKTAQKTSAAEPTQSDVLDKKQAEMEEDQVIRDLMGFDLYPSSKEKAYLTEITADPTIWTRGVIRYHRAKILEKLGRSEEARADWDYLESNQLPPDDRLH